MALGLVAVLALVAANGLFVATEFAYVAVRRTRVEQLASGGHARARLLLGSLGRLDTYIAATQLGVTMCSLALGWVGEPALAGLLEPPLERLLGGVAGTAAAHTIAVAVAFAAITTLLIVFGELAPKQMALARAERTALWMAAPMAVFARVFRPFIWALNGMGLGVARLAGVRPAADAEATLAPEELEIVMEASERAGLLSTAELLLARRGLEFGEIQASRIMVPRTEVVAIDAAATLAEALATVTAHPHRRYPVSEGDLDHVLGLLDAMDLLQLARAEDGDADWRALAQPVVAIPETVSVEVAVTEMRDRGAKLVVLIDEHGGASGIPQRRRRARAPARTLARRLPPAHRRARAPPAQRQPAAGRAGAGGRPRGRDGDRHRRRRRGLRYRGRAGHGAAGAHPRRGRALPRGGLRVPGDGHGGAARGARAGPPRGVGRLAPLGGG